MNQPQSGIFNETSTQFYYLEYSFHGNASSTAIKSALTKALHKGGRDIEVVIAFGKAAWNRLEPGWAPGNFTDFNTIEGVQGHTLHASQHDVWFWVHSRRHDDNIDQVLNIHTHMHKVATTQLDKFGFRYHDSRDLTGFIDGSANPQAEEARLVALLTDAQVGAGGSFVLTQQWVHNLEKFNTLSQTAQEMVIGRTKPDSVELDPDNLPPTSHVGRTDVSIAGVAQKIYRRSSPYANAEENGLYFVAFSRELSRFQVILERMFGVSGDQYHDQLIEFSTPVTSAYWFAPSQQDLEKILSG